MISAATASLSSSGRRPPSRTARFRSPRRVTCQRSYIWFMIEPIDAPLGDLAVGGENQPLPPPLAYSAGLFRLRTRRHGLIKRLIESRLKKGTGTLSPQGRGIWGVGSWEPNAFRLSE